MTVTINREYMSDLLVGKTLNDARSEVAEQYVINIIEQDGVKNSVPEELRWQRINVAVENNLVTKVLFIG
jgi:hypothetical protein